MPVLVSVPEFAARPTDHILLLQVHSIYCSLGSKHGQHAGIENYSRYRKCIETASQACLFWSCSKARADSAQMFFRSGCSLDERFDVQRPRPPAAAIRPVLFHAVALNHPCLVSFWPHVVPHPKTSLHVIHVRACLVSMIFHEKP